MLILTIVKSKSKYEDSKYGVLGPSFRHREPEDRDVGSKDQRLSLSKSSLPQLKLKSLMLQKKLTECSSNTGKEGTAH